jgi:hypothetical protein
LVADRKNIFLIGRRRNRGNEDQLTEMLAFLWQEAPDTLERWLDAIGVSMDVTRADVVTQFVIPSGKRPDIVIFGDASRTVVESKLGSGFGDTQISDYLDYLEPLEGGRALVLLTQRPETPPADAVERAEAAGIRLLTQRWHDMSNHLAEPGEESLAGDFVQLLIREGLVKPEPLDAEDWETWNGGYNVLLRLSVLLEELDPVVRSMRPGATWKAPTNGLSKRWIYRVWRVGKEEFGVGFGAAEGDSKPLSEPIAFAFVGNTEASEQDARRTVGDEAGTGRWSTNERLRARWGLLYSWPALARPAREVLTAPTFEEQIHQAATFLYEAAGLFHSRGFLPEALGQPAAVGAAS